MIARRNNCDHDPGPRYTVMLQRRGGWKPLDPCSLSAEPLTPPDSPRMSALLATVQGAWDTSGLKWQKALASAPSVQCLLPFRRSYPAALCPQAPGHQPQRS